MKEVWINILLAAANLAWAITVYCFTGYWWVALNVFTAGWCIATAWMLFHDLHITRRVG